MAWGAPGRPRPPSLRLQAHRLARAFVGLVGQLAVLLELARERARGADPRDVEKHWGLYDVERNPKAALQAARP